VVKVDHTYIEDNHVVQRYLLGKLSPGEEERFEQHYLECDECLDQLRLAESLHRGLKAVAVQEMTGRAIGAAATLSWWRRLGRWGRVSFVALILAAAAGPLVSLLPHAPQLTGPVTETQLVFLSPTRSGDPASGPVTRITRTAESKYIVISLDLMYPEHDRHRVSLIKGDEGSLWQSGPVEPDEMGTLVVTVPAGFLQAGDYSFEVTAIPDDGEEIAVASFPFRIVESTQ
jgi:hypothetical protein